MIFVLLIMKPRIRSYTQHWVGHHTSTTLWQGGYNESKEDMWNHHDHKQNCCKTILICQAPSSMKAATFWNNVIILQFTNYSIPSSWWIKQIQRANTVVAGASNYQRHHLWTVIKDHACFMIPVSLAASHFAAWPEEYAVQRLGGPCQKKGEGW